jgi:AcrR family transcriptional regulator
MQNAIPSDGVAERVARETLARRADDYSTEVRRLLDAALDVMRRCGTTSRPRVADIVAAAGLSNDAFYRHFASKDALVVALLEDGAQLLTRNLAERMAREETPEGKLRRWVAGIFTQASPEIADTTRAVMWNGGSAGRTPGRHFASEGLAALLHEPLAALGSTRPQLDAALAAHATLGRLTDHLWQHTRPTKQETDDVVAFLLAAVRH